MYTHDIPRIRSADRMKSWRRPASPGSFQQLSGSAAVFPSRNGESQQLYKESLLTRKGTGLDIKSSPTRTRTP